METKMINVVEAGFMYMSPKGNMPIDGCVEEFNHRDEAQWEGAGMKTVSFWFDYPDGKEIKFSCN